MPLTAGLWDCDAEGYHVTPVNYTPTTPEIVPSCTLKSRKTFFCSFFFLRSHCNKSQPDLIPCPIAATSSASIVINQFSTRRHHRDIRDVFNLHRTGESSPPAFPPRIHPEGDPDHPFLLPSSSSSSSQSARAARGRARCFSNARPLPLLPPLPTSPRGLSSMPDTGGPVDPVTVTGAVRARGRRGSDEDSARR